MKTPVDIKIDYSNKKFKTYGEFVCWVGKELKKALVKERFTKTHTIHFYSHKKPIIIYRAIPNSIGVVNE